MYLYCEQSFYFTREIVCVFFYIICKLSFVAVLTFIAFRDLSHAYVFNIIVDFAKLIIMMLQIGLQVECQCFKVICIYISNNVIGSLNVTNKQVIIYKNIWFFAIVFMLLMYTRVMLRCLHNFICLLKSLLDFFVGCQQNIVIAIFANMRFIFATLYLIN